MAVVTWTTTFEAWWQGLPEEHQDYVLAFCCLLEAHGPLGILDLGLFELVDEDGVWRSVLHVRPLEIRFAISDGRLVMLDGCVDSRLTEARLVFERVFDECRPLFEQDRRSPEGRLALDRVLAEWGIQWTEKVRK